MINGSHVIVFSSDAEADRAFLADVLGFPHVDAGGGWRIFALPPAEVAMHPADGATAHELYFMCDDIEATIAELRGKGVEFTADISGERWGRRAVVHPRAKHRRRVLGCAGARGGCLDRDSERCVGAVA